jgi:DNA-binding MarR family transcriptional regulator
MHQTDQFTAVLQEWVAVFMRHSMRNFIQYARESGLSMSQVNALFHIHRKGGCGVSEVGDNLGVTNAAASQMLERLVQQKLVLRTEDPADRRAKQLALTDKGIQAVQHGIHARQGWLEDLADLLSPGEKDQVAAALKILIEKTKKLENPVETIV